MCISNMIFLSLQADKAPGSPQGQAVSANTKTQILASLYWQKSPSISIYLILDWDLCVGIIPCQFP